MGPYGAGTGADGSADAILLEHDMALDGRSRLVFPHPDEANDPRGARTDDFKDDDRLVDDRCGAVKGGTKDHAVGIAAMARGDPKLEVTAEEPARLAAERRPVKAKARFSWITAWANVPPVIATGPTSFLAQALRILPSEASTTLAVAQRPETRPSPRDEKPVPHSSTADAA
jgi:hypothetical protein